MAPLSLYLRGECSTCALSSGSSAPLRLPQAQKSALAPPMRSSGDQTLLVAASNLRQKEREFVHKRDSSTSDLERAEKLTKELTRARTPKLSPFFVVLIVVNWLLQCARKLPKYPIDAT